MNRAVTKIDQAEVSEPNGAMTLFPSGGEWAMMKESAGMLVRSGFLPQSITKPEQAIAIMLKGREIGMPPMQAFAHINIIKGKPTLSAEGMLALILRHFPATKFHYTQNDDKACILEVTRPGNQSQTFSFTEDDAKRAGLLEKRGGWDTYRRAMLRSRCISEMARSLFPDAVQGCGYTPEELEDQPPSAKPSSTKPTEEMIDVIHIEPEAPKPQWTPEQYRLHLLASFQKHGWGFNKIQKYLDIAHGISISNITDIDRTAAEKLKELNDHFSSGTAKPEHLDKVLMAIEGEAGEEPGGDLGGF